jgi:hypothetical protein
VALRGGTGAVEERACVVLEARGKRGRQDAKLGEELHWRIADGDTLI